MYADLHIHTQCSDSTLSLRQVVEQAVRQNVGLISICDHNTTKAYPGILRLCAESGLECIAGVEIDTIYKGKSFHLLGYGIDLFSQPFQAFLAEARAELDRMSEVLVAKMCPHYPELSEEEYRTYRHDTSRGGWKGIGYLFDRGLCASLTEGMDFYRRYGVYYEDFRFPSVQQACRAVRAAGGIPVLAHPGDRLPNEPTLFSAALEGLAEEGVGGVECFYPSHTPEITRLCLDFCRKNDLLITGGCDSHGEFAKNVRGVTYAVGILKIDREELNLAGLSSARLEETAEPAPQPSVEPTEPPEKEGDRP